MAGLDGRGTFEQIRWNMAEKFGWTLDYIDSLPLSEYHEYLQIQDGLAHLEKSILK